MLNRKIDLTEHNDFSDFPLLDADDFMDVSLEDWNQDIVSLDMFQKMKRYEKFFGKKFHENGKWRVFQKTLSDYNRYESKHCQRCGKEFRYPWYISQGGLCEECDFQLTKELNGNKRPLPWTETDYDVMIRNTTMDVFDLR